MALYNYKTANPAFSKDVWKGYASTSNKMTVNGILLKSLFCIFLLSFSAYITWQAHIKGFNIDRLMYGGLVATLVFSLMTAFIHKLAPVLVPLYALSLGFFFGGISIYTERKFNGVPMQALGVTISTFLLMLFLYKARLVQVSQRFKSVLVVGIALIMTIYAISWSLQLFIDVKTPFILLDSTSYLSIAFNIAAAAVVAFTLLLDFDFIERKKNHVPKYMEWVATWGLLITLIWVYIEAIRLIKRMVLN